MWVDWVRQFIRAARPRSKFGCTYSMRHSSPTSAIRFVIIWPVALVPERQPGADAGGEHFEFLFAARNGARGGVEFRVDIGRFEKPIAVSNRVQDVVEHASLPMTEAFSSRYAL